MGLEIKKSFVIKAPADAVWDFLTDPRRVAGCLPGAAITEKIDEQSYAGTITVKVGPVTASYKGKMRFERLDRAAGEADIAASGQETKGKGGADMRMKSRVVEKAPGETEVEVVSDVNVVGVLAQFGRGMIQDVSDMMFQKFSDAMRRELESAAPAPEAPAAAASGPPEPQAASAASAEMPSAAPAASSPAPAPPAIAPPARAAAPPPPAQEAVLDVGAIGAKAVGRAAGRTLARPGFWIAVAVVAFLVYWFFLRT
jgi:carbon monoxide dehydrogenase subunit G